MVSPVLQDGRAAVEVDPGGPDVRLAVDGVALEAAVHGRQAAAVGGQVAPEGLLAELGAAAGVGPLGQPLAPARQPDVEVGRLHDHHLAHHLRVPGAAVFGAVDPVAARPWSPRTRSRCSGRG